MGILPTRGKIQCMRENERKKTGTHGGHYMSTPRAQDSPSASRGDSSISVLAQHRDASQRILEGWLLPLSRLTQANYRSALRALARDLRASSATLRPGGETEIDAATFLLALHRGNARNVLEGWAQQSIRELAPNTVLKRLAAVKSLLSYAETQGVGPGPVRPRTRIRVPRRVRKAPEVDAVAMAIRRLAGRSTPTCTRDAALLSCSLVLALRRAEARELRWPDDFDTTDQEDRGVAAIVSVTRKGGQIQDLSLPSPVWPWIREWLALRGDDAGYMFCRISRSDEVLPQKQHGHNHLSTLCAREGLGSAHRLRRTAARWVMEHGGRSGGPASIDQVRNTLGHASIKTSVEYLDDGTDAARDARYRLASAVKASLRGS